MGRASRVEGHNPRDRQRAQDHELDRDKSDLNPSRRAFARHVEDRHGDDDPGGEDVDQDPVRRDVEEQALGVGAERARHHRDGDEERQHVDERERSGDGLRKGRVEVAERAVLGRVAGAEPRERVARQKRDHAAEKERQPDFLPGDQRRLADQGEDSGADHRADPDRRHRQHAHRPLRHGRPCGDGGRAHVRETFRRSRG